MFNPFLKGQVSFKCGGGFIFIFYFSKDLCIIFNLQMRLGPRARSCFFALLCSLWTHWSLGALRGLLMGLVSPSPPHGVTPSRSSHQLEVPPSGLRHPQEHSVLLLIGPGRSGEISLKTIVLPAAKRLRNQDRYREQTPFGGPGKK